MGERARSLRRRRAAWPLVPRPDRPCAWARARSAQHLLVWPMPPAPCWSLVEETVRGARRRRVVALAACLWPT